MHRSARTVPALMARFLPRLTLLVGVGACSGDTHSGTNTPLEPAHAAAMRDSVTAALASWRGAINALDADRVAAHYLADSTFRWLEDGVIRYRHPLEVANAIRELAGTIRRTELLLDGTVITPLAPGVAALTTGFAQKVEDAEGRTGGFAGAISAVLVHRENGWVFRLGHTSSGGMTQTELPR